MRLSAWASRTSIGRALLSFSVIAVVVTPAAAVAEESTADASTQVAAVSLHLEGYELGERTVSVEVCAIPLGAETASVRMDGAEATQVPVPVGASAVSVSLTVPSKRTEVSAEVLDAGGAVVATSAEDLVVDTLRFIPAYPRVSVRWESFVMPSQAIRVTTSRAASVTARLGGRACRTVESAPQRSWGIVLPKNVPSGRARLRVYVRNAWGVRALSVPLWSLRWKPSAPHAILVDKSDFTLYYAEGYRLHKAYPVAIGMPGTPTRVGQFWLGAPRSAGGAWGVLRMALGKRKGTGALPAWGGYYIHGTNQPDSIGTEASHGCVRMYNSAVIDLSRHTRRHLTRVTIRP